MTDSPSTLPVLVVGATGSLGGKVVDELLKRGKSVRALVRATTDASRLENKGVEIARGDMLDLDSLVAAHARGGRRDHYRRRIHPPRQERPGHRYHRQLQPRRSGPPDRYPAVRPDQHPHQRPDTQRPHFWHKKVAEDKLEQLGVPFIALRPGAFIDQVASLGGNPVEKGRMMWLGKPSVPLTFVHTSDLAAYLAAAVDANAENAERIDIGWDRPVSVLEVADLMALSAGKPIRVRAVPSGVVRFIGAVAGRFKPIVQDMTAMFGWFDTGRYVANPRRQEQLFGPPPTAEDAITRLTNELVKTNHH